VLDLIERVQSVLTDAFFVLTIVVVSFQVANRFWFKLPVVWTADLAVLCFIWLGFLSASVAVRRSGHFRVTMLLDLKRLPPTGRRALELLTLAVIVVVSSILVFEGTRTTIAGLRETAPGLRVPMAWGYAAVPLCSLTAILFALEKIRDQWIGATPHDAAIAETEAA
jgi:TRAP-type C4-dicarboxylate transport system permease small subunit